MKLLRHTCLNGEIWEFHITPMLEKEIPKNCPNKQDCGQGWEEVDLYMYPGGSPFIFVGEGFSEKAKKEPGE